MPPTTTIPAIDVTVIGGYLGAGKTTLVNSILRHADQRVAVLVNDFGEINIDQDLIAGQDGDTISLTNGCICCSLVDGFSAALETIRSLDPRPERLVIEASGVADPATVAAYGHGPGLRLDATVVVADAETIKAKSNDVYVGDTVLRQLRSGDIIVLNKADLVSSEQLVSTLDWLRRVAPSAVLIDAVEAVIDPAVLFGVVAPQQHPQDQHAAHVHAAHVDAAHGHAAHVHTSHGHAAHGHAAHVDTAHVDTGHGHGDSGYESWTWTSDQPVDRSLIEALMDSLPDQIVRAKGLVFLAEDAAQPMVLQRVGRRWTMRRFDGSAQPPSRIVLIGFRGAMSSQRLDEAMATHPEDPRG